MSKGIDEEAGNEIRAQCFPLVSMTESNGATSQPFSSAGVERVNDDITD